MTKLCLGLLRSNHGFIETLLRGPESGPLHWAQRPVKHLPVLFQSKHPSSLIFSPTHLKQTVLSPSQPIPRVPALPPTKFKDFNFFSGKIKGFFKLGKKKDVGRAMQCLTRADSLAAMFERNHWSSLSYSPCRLSYSILLAKCSFSRMSDSKALFM